MSRFGEFILTYRVWLAAAIFLVSGLAAWFMPALRIEQDEAMWFGKDDPILIAYREFQQEFASDENAIIAYRADRALSGFELRYLDSLCDRLDILPNVSDVLSLTTIDDIRGTEEGLDINPLVQREYLVSDTNSSLRERIDMNHLMRGTLISEDFNCLGIILEMEWPKEDRKAAAESARLTVRHLKGFLAEESERTGKKFYLGGNLITDAEVARLIDSDMHKFFPLSVLLAALMVLYIFRSFLRVVFPVLSVLLALLWTLALKGLFDSPISPVTTTLFALVNVIGIANAIHLISHYNLALSRLQDRNMALREMFQRAGKACFYTSLTTAMGFGSLGISPLPVIRDMGLFSAFGIMSAFLISIIIVPFGLMLRPIDKSVFTKRPHVKLENVLESIARFDLRHPLFIVITGLLITAVMAAGIARIKPESSMLKYLKESGVLRRDAEFLDSALVGVSTIEVVLQGEPDDFKEPGNLKKMELLQNLVAGHPAVSTTHCLVDYLKLIYRAVNGDSASYFRIPGTREAVAQSLLLYEMSGGEELDDYVTIDYDKVRIAIRVRQMPQEQREILLFQVKKYVGEHFSEFNISITGFDNLVHETTGRIIQTEIQSISLAFGVILIIMCIIFGLKAGLVSIVPNAFPIVFLLGLMGYAGFPLNIATAIIASIAIGIVIDDTIHYFFHYRYEMEENSDGTSALLFAHRRVGSALCFTTVCLALGFGIFLLSDTHILLDYGLLSCIAVLVALTGDLLLGPVLLLKLRVFSRKDPDKIPSGGTS